MYFLGSHESKGGLTDAKTDENTVLFDFGKQNKYAEEIKRYIEEYNSNSTPTIQISGNSNLDEINKLKTLLDNGAITQEEYEAKKKQLLGL